MQPSEFAIGAVDIGTGKRLWRITSHGSLASSVLEGRFITEQLGTLVALP